MHLNRQLNRGFFNKRNGREYLWINNLWRCLLEQPLKILYQLHLDKNLVYYLLRQFMSADAQEQSVQCDHKQHKKAEVPTRFHSHSSQLLSFGMAPNKTFFRQRRLNNGEITQRSHQFVTFAGLITKCISTLAFVANKHDHVRVD